MKTQKDVSIAHITLNTGDVAMVPPSFLTNDGDLLQMFSELVKAGGGPIRRQPHITTTITNHLDGTATFSIQVDSTLCILGTICCNRQNSRRWWNGLRGSYDRSVQCGMALPLVEAGASPPRTPWLGVIILLPCLLLNPDMQKLLAVIEEDIAIAFVKLTPSH